MYIRRAIDKDAQGIHDAHMRSIREICSIHHTPEEISGWGYRPFDEERRLNAIRSQYVWVIENNEGSIEGYAHLQIHQREDSVLGYINGLYLTPQVLGQGNGRKLFLEMLEVAKTEKVNQIKLEATLTAHAFYKKLGFYDSAPMMMAKIGGSKVRCFPMCMDLGK